MKAETSEVILERNPHQRLLPASLTKMMLVLLAMECLEQGRVFLDDEVRVSRWATRVRGTRGYLRLGEIMTLGDLMKAVLISSANDAAVAVAEHLSGAAENFVRLMNLRAFELGMQDTIFYNVHGLPSGNGRDNVSTAYDMAILAAVLTKHPQTLEWSSLQTARIRKGTYRINNTNRLLGWYPGLDGLKTGYYRKAGYNMAATAKREGLRLIAVVMGSPTSYLRFMETENLLSKGFQVLSEHALSKHERLEKGSLRQHTFSSPGS
jgi:D-alanyl-D-alanine carboxypeptidase (penicillin-binding protein 5/6)